jgi:UDP-N-acetylmuramoylalanine--D-glutamate ligase
VTARPAPIESFAGLRVTVVGLGRFGGGVGAARWLTQQGAAVTVTDRASADSLADSISQLTDLDVTVHVGGHAESDFTEVDLLVVNPAVPKSMPLLAAALEAGVPYTTEINLFIERCRAPIIGVTGSVGKSTTVAMIGHIASQFRTTHVGGNIGKSLLADLDAIGPEDVVVLELSSFQLEDLPIIGVAPHIAVVTNLMPNHLDRHGTMESYAAAKRNIARFQTAGDVLIVNADDPALLEWETERAPRFEPVRTSQPRVALAEPGKHLPGLAELALAAVSHVGIARNDGLKALETFRALPHRLQTVGSRNGITYVNDSKCTTPEGAIAALESFDPGTAIILLGGYDKGHEFDALARTVAARAKGVVTLGATAGKIAEALAGVDASLPVSHAASLAEAVKLATSMAREGDVVLLSPACASWDMFDNYEQRGDQFAALAMAD